MTRYEAIENTVLYVVLIAIVSVPLFLHLGTQPIQLWDESLYAVNAFEMYGNGDFLVKHFDGRPDMWNTKPPLMIWIQVLSMKIFGLTELALRLPSAAAALFTILLIFLFAKRELGRPLLGFVTSIILVTSGGYVVDHVSRTGDHDAPLVLFMITALIYFYKTIENGGKNTRNIYIVSAALVCAVLTKGVFGLLFLPAMLLYALLRRRTAALAASRHTYIALGIFLAIVLGYYFLREHFNPGYLRAVWENEIAGRYTGVLEGERHVEGPFFYIRDLAAWQFYPWVFFLPLGIILSFSRGAGERKPFIGYVVLCFAVFLCIISIPKSKVSWYATSLLPLGSIIAGSGIHRIVEACTSRFGGSGKAYRTVLLLSILCAFCLIPYVKILRTIRQPHIDPKTGYGPALQHIRRTMPDWRTLLIPHRRFNAHILFYTQLFNNEYGYRLDEKSSPEELAAGDTVLVCEEEMLEEIRRRYRVEEMERAGGCRFFRINGTSASPGR